MNGRSGADAPPSVVKAQSYEDACATKESSWQTTVQAQISKSHLVTTKNALVRKKSFSCKVDLYFHSLTHIEIIEMSL